MGAGEAPAGWHPDPGGEQAWRWWDGTAWTTQLRPRDGDTPPTDPPPPAPSPAPPQPPPGEAVLPAVAEEQPGKLRRGLGKYLGLRTEEQSAGLTAYKQLLNDMVEGRVELTGLAARLRAARGQADLTDSKDAAQRMSAFRGLIGRVLADDYLSEQEDAELHDAMDALALTNADLQGPLYPLVVRVMIARANAGRLEAQPPQRVMPKRGEEVYLEVPANLLKEVAVREFRGGGSGVSFRVAKGVRFHTGGFRGRTVTVGTQIQVADSGVLGITNQRAIFLGERKTQEFRYDKLAGMQLYTDAINLQVTNRQNASMFATPQPELVAATINAAAQDSL